jgi:hypothetical protein
LDATSGDTAQTATPLKSALQAIACSHLIGNAGEIPLDMFMPLERGERPI